MKIIITDQPQSEINTVEFVNTKKEQHKIHRDIRMLVKNKKAKFHGRCLNNNNNRVYQIFSISGKRILIEDFEATEILKSIFDNEGRFRNFVVE